MSNSNSTSDGRSSERISIVTYEPEGLGSPPERPSDPDEDEGVTLSPAGDFLRGLVRRQSSIEPETLQNKLTTFLNSMNTVLRGIPSLLGNYNIDEIELSLEVGAEGELSILGTGGKITGTSGITLTLKHKTPPSATGNVSENTQTAEPS